MSFGPRKKRLAKFTLAHPGLTPDELKTEFEDAERARKLVRKAQKARRNRMLISPKCPLCDSPYSGKIHPNKIKDFDYFICNDCQTSDLPKEDNEICIESFVGGWRGIEIRRPLQDELAAIERARELKWLGIMKYS